MKRKKIDAATVRRILDYDPETGVFLWRPRGRELFTTNRSFNTWNSRFSGKPAGSICEDGAGYVFVNIGIFGTLYKAHRLAWMHITGEEPPEEIDHKNRNALYNSWLNLQDGTGVNSKNHKLQKNNTSGIAGVCWNIQNRAWAARCGQKHLGYFKDKNEAAQVVQTERRAQGYNPTHGEVTV